MSKRHRPAAAAPAKATGEVELIADRAHLERVVQHGIAKAAVSLDIITADFKAMMTPAPGNSGGRGRARSIIALFKSLADRGVEIRVLHAGVPSGPVLQELRRSVPRGVTIRRCPRLHAKAVIIDCGAMYLGSANLTGAGLGAKSATRRNFELGVWTTSSSLIDSVHGYFNALWEGRHCESCGRRKVCPVPLEEPAL